MARKSKGPWYRSDRDAWYVQHRGRQEFLCKGEANKDQAVLEWHRLMLGAASAAPGAEKPLAAVFEAFLNFVEVTFKPKTLTLYTTFLQSFLDFLKGKRKTAVLVRELTEAHLDAW